MASKVAGLVRNFLQTDGDALYLVAGEKIFITRGTAKTVAGREVVSEESFRAVVDELVPGVPAETLAQRRSRLPYVAGAGLPPVEIHFASLGGAPAMMIVRTGKGPAGEAPRPPEVVVAPAPPVESAPAPVVTPAGARDAKDARDAREAREAREAKDAKDAKDAKVAIPLSARTGADPLETLLVFARERGASDLLIDPFERPLFRLNGSLTPAGTASPGAAALEALVSGRAPARAAKALSESGSARFVLEVEGAGRCLFRVNRDRTGPSVVVRFLPPEAPRLESIGLPESVARLATPAPGLLLVAGPPGSGRTTTLAALAARASRDRGERVVTVEDPVEVLVPAGAGSVSQREAGSDVPSIREGLRAAADGDADVVVAGSVPDAPSAALLVELAASGRLVLAPAPAPSLALALQWLDSRLPQGRRSELRLLLAATFRGGLALALCRGRQGGRVAAAESVHPGSLVAELILSGRLATLPDHLRDSSGYVSLNASLAALVSAGLVEPREALLRSLDRLTLLTRLRDEGAALPPELHLSAP